jgi:hypothetical protein
MFRRSGVVCGVGFIIYRSACGIALSGVGLINLERVRGEGGNHQELKESDVK